MNTDHQNIARHYLQTVIQDFQGIKSLGDKALAQLNDEEMNCSTDSESNSVAVIIKHMSGNMISRWTDFLTTDGEKPGRNRDLEFMEDSESKAELIFLWEKGWSALFSALDGLVEENLLQTVYIRGAAHTVVQAIQRQVSHYSYHVGQIVFAAKSLRAAGWQSLSIPRGNSEQFNKDTGYTTR